MFWYWLFSKTNCYFLFLKLSNKVNIGLGNEHQDFGIVRQIFFEANFHAELQLFLLLFVLGRSSPHLPIFLAFGANSCHKAVPTFGPALSERMKTEAKTRGFQEQRDATRDGAVECGREMRELSDARDGTLHGVESRTGETEKHLRIEFPNGCSWFQGMVQLRRETRQ